MKSSVFITLALASLFAVAKGDEKMHVEYNVSGAYFSESTLSDNKFSQTVTITEGGKTINYNLVNVYESIVKEGAEIYCKYAAFGYLYSTDTDIYAVFNHSDDDVFMTGIATGKHNNTKWLYITLRSVKGFTVTVSTGTSHTATDGGYYVLAISTDFSQIKSIHFGSSQPLIPGTYGDNLYLIGTKITSMGETSICGADKNCFIYDVFEDNPKAITLDYYTSVSDFHTIKSDSDDTAIVVFDSDLVASSNSIYLLVFKKADGKFSLDTANIIGKGLTMASGEYKNNMLYMIAKATSLTIIGDGYEASATVVFATEDFSNAKWVQVLPFSTPYEYYIDHGLAVLNADYIVASFTHASSYVNYCGSEIFLRGASDIAVTLLDSATGECRNIKTVGGSGTYFYIGNTQTTLEGKDFLVNGFTEEAGSTLVKSLLIKGTTYICNNGTSYEGKCICKDGYVGEKCNIPCPVDDKGQICGGYGLCYLNEDGGADCLNFTTHESGSCPTYTSTSSTVCPECKCNNSDNSGSNKCNENGVTGVRPLFLLIGLIVLLML